MRSLNKEIRKSLMNGKAFEVLAEGIEAGKKVKVEIIAEYDVFAYEVRIVEGKHAGRYAVVNEDSIEKIEVVKTKKESLKVEFKAFNYEDYLKGVSAELSCTSEAALYEVCKYIDKHAIDFGLNIAPEYCGYEADGRYFESVTIEFEYGAMARNKKEFRALIKGAKKALNLR